MSHLQRSGPLAPGIAFVTGGARGLGNAIAVAFAKEGAAGVALVDIQNEKTFAEGKAAVEKYGTKCITIRADVTKEEDVENAVKKCVETFGRLDYAANFAGVAGPLEAIVDTKVEDFKKVLEVNTVGVWLCCKHEMAQMIKQDSIAVEEGRVEQRGSIVNAASVNAFQASEMTSGYTTSKHAVPGITKTAALEGRQHRIRVNAVAPGFLRTDLGQSVTTAGFPGSLPDLGMWKACELRQGRIPDLAEVGDVVVLLSTPRMSFVNGHVLAIDNGFMVNEDDH